MNTDNSENLTIEIWNNTDPLTINQAAALWVGEVPPTSWIEEPGHPNYDEDMIPWKQFKSPELFKKIRNDICDAVWIDQKLFYVKQDLKASQDDKEIEKFKAEISNIEELAEKKQIIEIQTVYFARADLYDDYGNKAVDTDLYYPNANKTTISREELAEWAISRNNKPPFLKDEIDKLLPYNQKHPGTPPYLNPEHKYFCIKLKIAVDTWMHLYDENNYQRGPSPKQQALNYIVKTFDLKSTPATEIATVINPGPKGGREKKGK